MAQRRVYNYNKNRNQIYVELYYQFLLYFINFFSFQVTMKWIELAVQKLPNQNSVGSLMASPEQIQIFLKSCEK